MKKLVLVLVLALVFALGLVSAASGAGVITYTSGFQVQNLSASSIANISISYYKQDGTLAIAAVSDTIPAGSSKTYYPIAPAAPFNGSVVVSSDQPVVAIANTLGNGTAYAASTSSFSSGSTTVNVPLVMRGNYGFDTWFNVQNAGSSDANVTVTYNNGTTQAATIKAGAAATFNQATNTALAPTPYVGSATITSNQPVVASVMQVGSTGFNVLMGYNAFSSGATSVKLPLVMGNNYGYYTGIQVMNAGTLATNVTIAYGGNTAGAFAPASDTCTNLLPSKSCTVLQREGQWGAYDTVAKKYVGSATVTNSAAQNLVAIVNQVCIAGKAGCPNASVGTAYEGFAAGSGSLHISAPLVMANNYNYYTGIQVMNVGTGACAVTVNYSANTAGSFAPAADSTPSLAPNASVTYLQREGQWGAYQTVAKRYVGSATIHGTGANCSLSAIVNQVWPTATGDQFMTYDGFNY